MWLKKLVDISLERVCQVGTKCDVYKLKQYLKYNKTNLRILPVFKMLFIKNGNFGTVIIKKLFWY